MSSWTSWLVVASPLLGLAAAAALGRPTWPRALGAAAAAGVLAMALSLWRGGLMVGGPRGAVGDLAGRPNAGDYLVMLGWAAAYALVAGAVATGVLRAAGWRR